MSVPDPTESRPSTNVHARPSPPEERPSQRIRREDEPQLTRLSLYGHRHFVSHPPFTPHNPPRSVPYDTLGQDAEEIGLEGNNIGHAAGSGAMPAIESSHDTLRTNPGISEDELIDQQVDQLIASCGPIREGVFDNLGAILAPYQPGYSGGTGIDADGSGNPTQQFHGATGSTPQMATQQSTDWSCSEGVSASSSWSLACSQRYSNLQADPYYFNHSDQPGSSSSGQYGFTNISPPIAGPSTTSHTSTASYPPSRSVSYHPHNGHGTYNPPDTSSMARSLSTSDIPSMAAVPGDVSGLTASTSGNPTHVQAQYAFTASQISSVNAQPDNLRTASATKTSNTRMFHEIPPSQRFIPSLSQPSMTSPVPRPSLLTTTPTQPVSKPNDHELQTVKPTDSSAGGPSGGPMAEGSADQERTTLKEDTEWIDRSAVLIALVEEMRSRCKVPKGIERVRAFRGLRYLFKEMFELCYSDDHGPHVDIRTVSHLSIFR